MSRANIGVYGLGVMGRNLALNFEDKGNSVSVYNRRTEGEETVTNDFLSDEGKGKNFRGHEDVRSFVTSLSTPRKILMMVKAGKPVDLVIEELLPFLDNSDILIDGGNSNYNHTNRRVEKLAAHNIRFVGMGVSGGEEGARHGPSMMPGGNPDAWKEVRSILEPAAARAFDGSPCCTWIGSGGAGHFVKMVHNGIEYADMQIIAEAYHLMKHVLGMNSEEISKQYRKWNKSKLNSYLIEITGNILAVKDESGIPLTDKILDSAGQKGTGKWTAITALELGVPLPGIAQSVFARFASSYKELRSAIAARHNQSHNKTGLSRSEFLSALADTLLASRMVSYAEGFHLIQTKSNEAGWKISPGEVARIWQGGCIIRSKLLNDITMAFRQEPGLPHLFLSESYYGKLAALQDGWRQIITEAVKTATPAPNIMASLSLFDTMRYEKLPANIIQAQRDYFGAHTYERTDMPRGEFFHTDWKNKS